jgi:hypothetical protein
MLSTSIGGKISHAVKLEQLLRGTDAVDYGFLSIRNLNLALFPCIISPQADVELVTSGTRSNTFHALST